MNRAELKLKAKNDMRACKNSPYLVTLLYVVIIAILGLISKENIIISIIAAILTSIFNTGYSWWALSVARNNDNIGEFKLAFINFIYVTLLYLLMLVLITIGYILFIIPGLIIFTGLSVTTYCLRDNLEAGFFEAIKHSWKIMKGHKMDFFILLLSFTPWIILSVFTFGIAYIYVIPYIATTKANFYDSIKD